MNPCETIPVPTINAIVWTTTGRVDVTAVRFEEVMKLRGHHRVEMNRLEQRQLYERFKYGCLGSVIGAAAVGIVATLTLRFLE